MIRSKVRTLIPGLILLVTVVGALELMAHVALSTVFKDYAHMRKVLKGDIQEPHLFQNCIGQAYLLYVPSPDYSNQHGLQHNEQGYRGRAVPVVKPPGTLRVLCMGGSTTYGWTVDKADQTYPAHLERMLNQHLPAGINRIEVINAGLPWGTSAEMLTHYHFKYYFYEPDLVIIDAGGNDGEAATDAYYHPDYSHYRQPMPLQKPLPAFGAFLLKSRVISLVLVPAVASFRPGAFTAVKPDPNPPDVMWFPQTPETPAEAPGFYHNLEALVSEIQANGARPILVPFRLAPRNEFADPLKQAIDRNEQVLKSIADQHGIPFAPFPLEAISGGNWTDGCHLNGEGAYEKAAHLLPYVQATIDEILSENPRAPQ